jgi:hypothetical protein
MPKTLRRGDHGPEVQQLQNLLNGRLRPSPGLPESELFGPATENAVIRFQRQRKLTDDGVVGPNTWKALQQPYRASGEVGYGAGAASGQSFDFKGKTLNQRVEAFRQDAEQTYGVKIRITREMETDALKQQTMHVAHMFYYNNFQSRQPAQHEPNGSKPQGVIKWEHFSKADLVWAGGVTAELFLRDADNRPCVRQGGGWSKPPDKERSKARALAVLASYGVATDGKKPEDGHNNMVAPGIQGCGEPCRCGGNKSRHLSGEAADLNKADLAKLTEQLQKKNAGTLNGYLAQFGLHRPMSSETHHVECLGT